jgi:hypothetical protein
MSKVFEQKVKFRTSALQSPASLYKQYTSYHYKTYVAQGYKIHVAQGFSPAQKEKTPLWQPSYYDHVRSAGGHPLAPPKESN